MKSEKLKIERMNKGSWGKVRAFFDIMTDEGFTIKGFKIIEGINGLFVGVPSQKGKDDEYFDTVFIAPELREDQKGMDVNKQTGGNYIISDVCHYLSAKHTLTRLNLVRDSFGRKPKGRG